MCFDGCLAVYLHFALELYSECNQLFLLSFSRFDGIFSIRLALWMTLMENKHRIQKKKANAQLAN